MPLYNQMAVQCVFLRSLRVPDGSGGYNTAWTEGERFEAAIVRSGSTEAKIAEAAGTVETFTVTVPRSVKLPYHAVFKRIEDGKTFRVTSDNTDQKAPAFSALDIAQSTAEAWRCTE